MRARQYWRMSAEGMNGSPQDPDAADRPAADVAAEPSVGQLMDELGGRLGSWDLIRLKWRLMEPPGRAVTAGQYSVGLLSVVAWVAGFVASRPTAPKEFYST